MSVENFVTKDCDLCRAFNIAAEKNSDMKNLDPRWLALIVVFLWVTVVACGVNMLTSPQLNTGVFIFACLAFIAFTVAMVAIFVCMVISRKTFYSFVDKDGNRHTHARKPTQLAQFFYSKIPSVPEQLEAYRIPGPIAQLGFGWFNRSKMLNCGDAFNIPKCWWDNVIDAPKVSFVYGAGSRFMERFSTVDVFSALEYAVAGFGDWGYSITCHLSSRKAQKVSAELIEKLEKQIAVATANYIRAAAQRNAMGVRTSQIVHGILASKGRFNSPPAAAVRAALENMVLTLRIPDFGLPPSEELPEIKQRMHELLSQMAPLPEILRTQTEPDILASVACLVNEAAPVVDPEVMPEGESTPVSEPANDYCVLPPAGLVDQLRKESGKNDEKEGR